MTGCRVCWLREHGRLSPRDIVLGPERAHVRALIELGCDWAGMVLNDPDPPWWQRWLFNPWPADPVRIKARQWQQIHVCPVAKHREWPVTTGPAA